MSKQESRSPEPLTLRLVPRPSARGELDGMVDVLKGNGFDVLSAFPTGLTVSASAEAISRFFKAEVDVDKGGPHFSTDPIFDRLPSKYSYSAYFPGKPTYF